MQRLIVCDIDNTLLPAGGVISEKTRKVLASLGPDTGFSIATGRSFHVVRKFTEDLDISVPVITSNGAQVYDYQTSASVYEHPLSEKDTQDLAAYLIAKGFDFVAYGAEGIYYRPDSTHLAFFENYNASVRPEIRARMIPISKNIPEKACRHITKFLVYFPTEELTNHLRTWEDLEITASMHHVIDIMRRGCTKGNAVVALAEYLQIPLSQVYCFGDGDNDVSMFTCGAVGVAMGNASDEVKAAAQIVTRSCKDDGVAWAIRHLLPS